MSNPTFLLSSDEKAPSKPHQAAHERLHGVVPAGEEGDRQVRS